MAEIPFLQFAFLDIEASSLDDDSWPIEVGLSWIDQNLNVQTFESLIRPAPEWPEHAWSPVSAKIHNIPRRDLDDAPDVHTVAIDLLAALNGRTALSDAPPFERHWLDRLCAAADVKENVSLMDFSYDHWAQLLIRSLGLPLRALGTHQRASSRRPRQRTVRARMARNRPELYRRYGVLNTAEGH